MEENMIPGSVSKMTESTIASATSITAKTDIVNVTGTTAIQTILPGLGTAQSQFLILNPVTAGGVTLGTSGNILQGVAVVQHRPVFMVYVRSLAKWVINSGA
jgi:hypothetical protein